MGIQINGITDTILATDGSLSVSGQQLTGVTDINASGIVTATQVNVGTGVTLHSTNGVQVGGNLVHSTGLNINQINVTGVGTFSNGIRVTGVGSSIGIGTNSPRSSIDIFTSDAVCVPIGTTGQRPSSSQRGMVRYNTTVGAYEVFDGTFWFLITNGQYVEGLEYLVVGGGGGGGCQAGWWGSGGGGAGGVLNGFTSLPLNIAIPIVVGAGGAGGTNTNGQNGNNSVLGTLVAYGGGFGSGQSGSFPFSDGGSGGSGGGASAPGSVPGKGVMGQGNPGGDCYSTNTNTTAAGGGGGAATAGKSNLNVDSNIGGSGGSGIATNISGSYATYGGGGGGGRSITGGTFGVGGAGGGGRAGLNTSGTLVQNGTANTGGGGGGSRETTGGNGGSGVIILKLRNTLTATFSGGVTSSLSTAVSGFKIYTITATSTTNETVTFS